MIDYHQALRNPAEIWDGSLREVASRVSRARSFSPYLDLPKRKERSIIVIGGGFSSLAFVANLAVLWKGVRCPPLTIYHIEKNPSQALAGFAYSDYPNYDHSLNLQAERVGLFPTGKEPPGIETFARFIRDKFPDDQAGTYLNNPPRKLFARYAAYVFSSLLEKAGKKIDYVPIAGQADSVFPPDLIVGFIPTGGTYTQYLHADRIVLANGFGDVLRPEFAREAWDDQRFVASPYGLGAEALYAGIRRKFDAAISLDHVERIQRRREILPRKGGIVDPFSSYLRDHSRALVIGTGLSATDAVLRLVDSKFQGPIYMMSRHIAQNAGYTVKPLEDFSGPGLREPIGMKALNHEIEPSFLEAKKLSSMIKSMRTEFQKLIMAGYSSEAILSHWERFVSKVVENFPGRKPAIARFLKQFEGVIRARRVGVVPEIHQRIDNLVRDGKLRIVAGNIASIYPVHDGLQVRYTPRGSRTAVNTVYSHVVLALGGDTSFQRTDDPLWQNLLRHGYATRHWTGKGVTLTEKHQLVNERGRTLSIYVIGIPASGHMMVTRYEYPEKPGAGGRLGPFALNIPCIVGEANETAHDVVEALARPRISSWRKLKKAVAVA